MLRTSLAPLFWTCADICPWFQSQGGFLRFTSGVTPADLFDSQHGGSGILIHILLYKHWWGLKSRIGGALPHYVNSAHLRNTLSTSHQVKFCHSQILLHILVWAPRLISYRCRPCQRFWRLPAWNRHWRCHPPPCAASTTHKTPQTRSDRCLLDPERDKSKNKFIRVINERQVTIVKLTRDVTLSQLNHANCEEASFICK